jgi:excinuclease UvrABC nuclease subunit
MRIKKRWYVKPFTEKNVRLVSENPGVYMLMGGNDAVKYVGYSSNLRQQLLEHLTSGYVPTEKFRAYETSTVDDAQKYQKHFRDIYDPRYNYIR